MKGHKLFKVYVKDTFLDAKSNKSSFRWMLRKRNLKDTFLTIFFDIIETSGKLSEKEVYPSTAISVTIVT